MKRYTQKHVDALSTIDGTKHCPFGSYVDCTFDNHCEFTVGCTFGSCKFGSYCEFGRGCKFDDRCAFGNYCEFGSYCQFGRGCFFSSSCIFSSVCQFGYLCKFGSHCAFGDSCKFNSGCSFEGHKARTDNPFISLDGAGSENRKTYFFDFEGGIFVRSGYFFGTLQEFRQKVLQDDTTSDKRSVKTLVYLGFSNLACAKFNQMENVE